MPIAATVIKPQLIVPPSAGYSEQALLRLLQLASSALPVGSFSYSEGLEYVAQAGKVSDAAALRSWLEDGLTYGAAQFETALVARAYDAWREQDLTRVHAWDQWLSATRETEELRNQGWDTGRALLRLLKDLKPSLPNVEKLFGAPCNYATAFGIAAAHWEIERSQALLAYLQAWVANIVSAGVKLIPLGQTAGQQLLWDLQESVVRAAQRSGAVDDDDLGSGNWGLTLASMAHEIQYMRLFRS